MKIIDVPGIVLLLFILSGCAQNMFTEREELSLDAIQEADSFRNTAQSLSGYGLLEAPSLEWIDRESAYYIALNAAWANGDEKKMEYFLERLEDLYSDLVEAEATPPGQEL